MLSYFWIGIGSALGGAARYGAALGIAAWLGDAFPWGTILINITGSFIIGFFATLTSTDGRLLVGTYPRQFVMTGFCGGYTTFSAFALQTLVLARHGNWLGADLNIFLSLLLCLLGVWLGHALAALINR